MSTFKVPNGTRVAIWRAYERRCAYCGEPVSYAELDVDHILPESLRHNSPEWERVRVELGLEDGFNLNSVLNFLPAHRHCNRAKSNEIFKPARACFFLELAHGKEALVRSHLASLALQNQKEQVLAAVANAFETGVITMGELADVNSDSRAFPLSRSLEFADGSTQETVRPEEIDALLDKPVLVGGSKTIDGVEFVNDSGGSMKVRTCREYRAAQGAGFYPLDNFSIKMAGFLHTAHATIAAVARARVAAVSYLRDPYAGVCDLHLLPTATLPVIGPDMDSELKRLTEKNLKELAVKDIIHICDVSSTRLHFQWQFAGAAFTELLRADLDGDGVEELLIQYPTYAVGGTLTFVAVGMLRRVGSDEMFELSYPNFVQ